MPPTRNSIGTPATTPIPPPEPVIVPPTVGRVIHYAVGVAGSPTPTVARPAIITHVWSDTVVNATVFYDPQDEGRVGCKGPTPATSITLGTGPGTWSWPPRV
jgi:hypothetical protein